MKNILLFCFSLSLFGYSTCNPSVAHEKDELVGMRFVKLVQKRYYFIHRLERPIKALLFIHHKLAAHKDTGLLEDSTGHHEKGQKKIIIEPGTALLFQHDGVRKYVRKIEQTQKIDAVQELWADFTAYKYIESDSFVQETLKVIMLLYKSLIFNAFLPKRLDLNDMIPTQEVDHLLHSHNNDVTDNFTCILNLLSSVSEQKDFLVNNNLRLYLINRLKKSITLLNKISPEHFASFWNCLYVAKRDNIVQFQHEAVAQCLDAIVENKKLDALFILWTKFNSYNYIDDTLFLKEFVSMQYLIYSRLIACAREQKDKAPTPQEILELYDTIAGLPMPEALNSLDLLVEELTLFVEKYELDSQMSWTTWFKKYWWVPPVALVSFYYNFLWRQKSLI